MKQGEISGSSDGDKKDDSSRRGGSPSKRRDITDFDAYYRQQKEKANSENKDRSLESLHGRMYIIEIDERFKKK